jgi:predicted RNA-binding Zn ribbon-like protein
MQHSPHPRQPAPGDLALVQDFVNTAELPGGYDELADVATSLTWLRAHGFEFTLDEPQRRRLTEFREQLRTLLGVNQGQPLPESTAARLSRMLNTADVHPIVDVDGVHLTASAHGVDGLLASLLTALVRSTIDGSFRRLKVCRSDSCQWTFYDCSRNGRGTWCSMQVCGGRAKAKAYRSRQRQEEATT